MLPTFPGIVTDYICKPVKGQSYLILNIAQQCKTVSEIKTIIKVLQCVLGMPQKQSMFDILYYCSLAVVNSRQSLKALRSGTL